jgi:hypothetical protein
MTESTAEMPELKKIHSHWAYRRFCDESWTEIQDNRNWRRLGAAKQAVKHMREIGQFPTEKMNRLGLGEFFVVRDLFGQEHWAHIEDFPSIDFNFDNNPPEYVLGDSDKPVKV